MRNNLVIALIHRKGGEGKSTIGANLAFRIAETGMNVGVLDVDDQKSMVDFYEAREDLVKEEGMRPLPFSVDFVSHEQILERLPLESAKHDVTIVDAPGRIDGVTKAVLLRADVVLIPCLPKKADVKSLLRTIPIFDEINRLRAEQGDEPLQIFVFFNMCRPGTKSDKNKSNLLKYTNLKLLNSRIHLREVYSETFGDGLTVYDVSKNPATDEINALWAELKEEIDRA